MMKYILDADNRSVVVGVSEDFKVNILKNAYYGVDYSWVVSEDGILEYAGETFEVKKDDLIFLMYAINECDENGREIADKNGEIIIISKDSKLADYYTRRRIAIEKAKELRKACNKGVSAKACCDSPSNC